MQIIDFHTHIYPDAIAEKATRTTCAYYHLDTPLIGTAEQLLAQGKKAGISRCVLLPVAMKPEQTRRVNEFIQSQTQAHPEFFGFGALHPALPDLVGELSFLQEHGFFGVKLHPDLQEFDLDDERLFPAYDWLQGRLPVLFHCGDKTRDYSHPKRLRRVLDNFPNLTVIAAHLGGWSMKTTASSGIKSAPDAFSYINGMYLSAYSSFTLCRSLSISVRRVCSSSRSC